MRIQVALDLTDLLEAVRLSKKLCKAGVEILEAGTPLIKTFGIASISAIKSACPRAEVVADMKTVDTGALEVELASMAGADMVTALGSASEETLEEFVSKARELGVKPVLDLIGITSYYDHAAKLLNRGIKPDVMVLHVGIDVQKRRGVDMDSLVDEAERVRELGVGVALAGGIGVSELSKLRRCNVDIIVVGRAITRSENPVAVYSRMRDILGSLCGRT